MVTKTECINIFNAMIRGTPISFQEKLLPLVSEYLTEINCEKIDKMIYLIVQNPQLINQTFPKIVEHYCRKYCILSIRKVSNSNEFNKSFKTILYYE